MSDYGLLDKLAKMSPEARQMMLEDMNRQPFKKDRSTKGMGAIEQANRLAAQETTHIREAIEEKRNMKEKSNGLKESNALARKELDLLRKVCGLVPELDEMLLEGMDGHIQQLIVDTFELASAHDIKMTLSPERTVSCEGVPVNGFFIGGEGIADELACAIGQPFEQWIQVFLHESCHMDQYIEDSDTWNDTMITPTIEAGDVMQMWIDGLVELTAQQKENIIGRARDVELDCEKRSVEKIKKYNLPIDIDEYIQKANAYVLFYNVIKVTRSWYKTDREPYNLEEVWRKMPTHFDLHYTVLSDDIRQVFSDAYGIGIDAWGALRQWGVI